MEDIIQKRVNSWLKGPYDEDTKTRLKQKLDNKEYDELTDAFYRDLEFGTGGLRGIMGDGTNRMNIYTLGMATQGLSNYLNSVFPDEEIKVVIAHDNRNNAEHFAQTTADVFSANGIRVYFFEGLRPTPELSFAIRELGCQSGIMLTASHNPKEYSGYKAYWNDGGQVVSPHDKNIIAEVRKVDRVDKINFNGNPSLIERIGPEMDERYIKTVASLSLRPEIIRRQADMPVVFSPIHGTAVDIVPKALKAVGFSNIHLVEEQCVTDGNFPTVVYPNPEEHEAMTMAVEKAKTTGASLVMATDPDADRVGVAVPDKNGEYVLLNGNQAASLLIHYVLKSRRDLGLQTPDDYVVKTIVTTYLIDKIADSYDVTCYNVLTGFKFIGALMTRLEQKRNFVAGGEESYGYLVGDHVRDKDAVVSCTMIAEMTAWYRSQGISLLEALDALYAEFGMYREKLTSLTKKGKSGAEEIKAMMEQFRESPPERLGGEKVVALRDYLSLTETDLISGQKTPLDFPASNVLQFVTENGSLISARPSGTEPKIKFYISVNHPVEHAAEIDKIRELLDERIRNIENDFV